MQNKSCDVDGSRLVVLDGWRGISISLVLAAHLLPLGRKSWELNAASGVMGMAIFFTLSGFLITSFLLNRADVLDFLVRRLFRIVPLAWLCMVIAMLAGGGDSDFWRANFLFYANWPPMALGELNGHLWSLCVEMQFYFGIALLVVLARKYWAWIIPILCIIFTAYRMADGVHAAVNTYYRVDEILAGSLLALLYRNAGDRQMAMKPSSTAMISAFVLFVASCHPLAGFLNYFRPYLAAATVGLTLFNGGKGPGKVLSHRLLVYLATISYALYVIHPLLAHTWLGSGEGLVKYLKRPLLFMGLFFTAHLSTFYLENRFIAFGKSLGTRLRLQFS